MAAATVKDPVCGMDIAPEGAAATASHQGQTYHFCSGMCKTKFSMNPAKYVGGPGAVGGGTEGHGDTGGGTGHGHGSHGY